MRTTLITRAERGRVGLLVSVRNAAEAVEALAGGADVIDVKEPARGPLGAADREVIEQVVRAVANSAPVTVAGGELLDHIARPSWSGQSSNNHIARPSWSGPSDARERFRPSCSELAVARWSGYFDAAIVKFGFAGCAMIADWRRAWADVCDVLPEKTRPVAVAYADWRNAQAVAPADVLHAAVSAHSPAVLVDTWDKSAGCLFDHWSRDELSPFIAEVRDHGMLAVIAGSLSRSNLREAVRLEPDYIAVRNAACEGGRHGAVSRDRVAEFRSLLTTSVTNSPIAAGIH